MGFVGTYKIPAKPVTIFTAKPKSEAEAPVKFRAALFFQRNEKNAALFLFNFFEKCRHFALYLIK